MGALAHGTQLAAFHPLNLSHLFQERLHFLGWFHEQLYIGFYVLRSIQSHIDAMGTQKGIAGEIVEAGAD